MLSTLTSCPDIPAGGLYPPPFPWRFPIKKQFVLIYCPANRFLSSREENSYNATKDALSASYKRLKGVLRSVISTLEVGRKKKKKQKKLVASVHAYIVDWGWGENNSRSSCAQGPSQGSL